MKQNGIKFEDLEEIKSGNHRAYPLKLIAWIYLSVSIISSVVLLCFSISMQELTSTFIIYSVICLFQGVVIFYLISGLICLIENTHATNKLLNEILNNQKSANLAFDKNTNTTSTHVEQDANEDTIED